MRTLLSLSVIALAVGCLLATDSAEAVPVPAPLPDGAASRLEAPLLARRKRPAPVRRKKPKPPPKPAPAAEPAPAPEPDPGATAIPLGPGGRTRVDFDAQLIKGQTTKAGEVQILERKDSELKSMVKRRTSFRDEIILSVFPEKAGSLK